MVVLSSVMALSQTPRSTTLSIPTSGAMLTINGTVGSNSVNRNIYDSQIHTGNLRSTNLAVASETNCNSVDAGFPTDAYVLQGGSGTGCDPGDTFETAQGTGTASITGTGYSFGIETTYTFGGCNTAGTICANPDTGFLTVTNNSSGAFT